MSGQVMLGFIFLLVFILGESAAAETLQPPITPEKLAAFAEQNKIQDVDGLLKTLPEDLRSNFVLVYNTRNTAQFASEKAPRVILFSDDGRLRLTFTGDANAKGGQTLEMMHQTDSGKFKMSTLSFQGGSAVHEQAPKSCHSCHGNVLRPIWDGYPIWPGAFGSDRERLRMHESRDGKQRELDKKFKTNAKEIKYLEDLRKNGVLKSGRYANLVNYPDYSISHLHSHLANLNMHFSQTLTTSTNRQIVGEVLGNENFVKYLPWLIRQFQKPAKRDFYLTADDWKGFPDSDLDQFKKEFEKKIELRGGEFGRYEKEIEERMERLNPGAHTRSFFIHYGFVDNDQYALLEALADRAGIPHEFWKPGLTGSIRQIGGLEVAIQNLHNVMVEQLLERDPALRGYVQLKAHRNGNLYEFSPEGLKHLEENLAKIVGYHPLVVTPDKNTLANVFAKQSGNVLSRCGHKLSELLSQMIKGQ